ncbi:MAG: glycosyltransferase family 2 protein [Chloroflexota bacterium]|nr:glycosyltransferase family 2 protein [Chloroflexota bacterium]
MDISIIVPTYNEKDSLSQLVEELHRALSGHSYEIIVVDDSSSDGTAELALALSQKYPVKLISRKNKRGLASAVVDGLEQAQGKLIGVMDADLQHPPEVMSGLVREIEAGADLAIASRHVETGGSEGWSLTRRAVSRGAIFLAHLFLPSTRSIRDPMSGFFLFRREAVRRADLRPIGYKILLEVLNAGQFQKTVEVPYTFRARSRGESKLRLRQQADYLAHIYSLMRRNGELLRFAKFCLVGLSGVVVNMGLLWLLTEFAGLFYLASAAISIETSIITNFTLDDYFTFPDRRRAGHFRTRILKFNAVSLAGLTINLGILWLLTSVFGIYYLLSNIVGIAVVTLWNYLLNSWWTWK